MSTSAPQTEPARPPVSRRQVGIGAAIATIIAAVFALEGGYVGHNSFRRRNKLVLLLLHGKNHSKAIRRACKSSLGRGGGAPVSGLRAYQFALLRMLHFRVSEQGLRQGSLQRPLHSQAQWHRHDDATKKPQERGQLLRMRRGGQWQGRLGVVPVSLQSAAQGVGQASASRRYGRQVPDVRQQLPRLRLRFSPRQRGGQTSQPRQRDRRNINPRTLCRSVKVRAVVRELPSNNARFGKGGR